MQSAWKEASDENDPTDDFAKTVDMLSSQYHGGAFDGSQCTGLLKSLNKFEAMLPEELACYMDCLSALNDVTTACLGKELTSNYWYW